MRKLLLISVFLSMLLIGCSANYASTPKDVITTATSTTMPTPNSTILSATISTINPTYSQPNIEIYLDSNCTLPWSSTVLPTPQSISPDSSSLTVYLKNVGDVSADVSVIGSFGIYASSGLVEINPGDCKPTTIIMSSPFEQSDVDFLTTPTTLTTTPSLTSIIITANSSTNLTLGGNGNSAVQFTAKGIYSDGAYANITYQAIWSSSNPKIMYVVPDDLGSSGLVTPNSPGTVIITASLDGITSQNVSVTAAAPPSLISMTITPSSPNNLGSGSTLPFIAIGKFSDGSTKDITNDVSWSSSNTNIAVFYSREGTSPDVEGIVTGISPGTTNITATYFNFYPGEQIISTPISLTVF